MLLPWLAAVVELVYFRGHIAGQRSRAMEVLSWSAFLLPTVAAISLILLNLDWIEAGYASRPFTLAERLLSQGRILWIYISWFLAPRLNELGMFHDDIPLSVGLLQPISTLLAAVAWPLVLACSVVVSRRLPEVLFATLFFVVAHCIESSVLALELVFEHRNYLPSVALAVWLATAFMRVRARLLQHEVGSTPATLPACVFVAVLALSTFVRASGWASEFDMSRAAVERHPESPRSGLFYANALLKRGNAEADAAQRSQLLGLARHEFELVYQSGEEQLAALVMLYVLDEQLYPGLSRSDAWLSGIERGTWERPLSATDFAAMSALVACFESDGCSLQDTELLRLLDLFAERFSRPVAVHSLRLRVLKATGVGPEEILALAEKVLEESPESIQMRYEEIAFLLDLKRYAGAHEAAMALMAVDPERRQLPAIIDSFGRATGPAQEP